MSLRCAQSHRFSIPDMRIEDSECVTRTLSDLEGFFVDEQAYQEAIAEGDPTVYRVYSVSPANGAGDLSYGLGVLLPGKIGREFYLTKGHQHEWEEAAEVYVGLAGDGMMLLEDSQTGKSETFPLGKDQIVYVPGHTAHRTINWGDEPLVYLGIYPAAAGHDYGYIADRNFHCVVVEGDEGPQTLERSRFLGSLEKS